MTTVNTPATPTGIVIRFPDALTKPVIQCRRYGPLPKGITSIPKVRRNRMMAEYDAAKTKQSVIKLDRIIREQTFMIESFKWSIASCVQEKAAAVAARQKAVQS